MLEGDGAFICCSTPIWLSYAGPFSSPDDPYCSPRLLAIPTGLHPAWHGFLADTPLSFKVLATGAANVLFVYHPHAWLTALAPNIAASIHYAWRDSFMPLGNSLPRCSAASVTSARS